MTYYLKYAALAFTGFGRGLALCAVLMPAPIFAEGGGWRLPAFAAKPAAAVAENQTQPAPAKGWALPAPSVRLLNAAQQANVRPAPRRSAPLLPGPSAIVTAFSGHSYGRPLLPAGEKVAAMTNPDYHVIDLDGISVSLSTIADFGHAPMGREIARPVSDALYARQIGQVFGAVLDDANQPNLYLAATSAYGVQIVGPDTNADGLPDRLKQGAVDARFMAGQWGDAQGAGPRTIWRVDGATGAVEVFAYLGASGAGATAPSLGNLAFDATHRALFASDLETGLITRFALDGRVLDSFDHGSTARPLAGLDAAPATGKGVAITDPAFDPLDPATWGMAPDARRVWGLTVHQGRLYYSVAVGKSPRPELWSVGVIPETGAFAADARWELTLPEPMPAYEISDIGFDETGAVVLAQRGPRALSYDFTKLAEVGRAEVARFVLEAPQDDPSTPSIWMPEAAPYAVGFADALSNTTGGLAFGPGYDEAGRLDFSQCTGTLWTTGENLRRDPALQGPLSKGGSLVVDGIQAQPTALTRDQNTPPWISYSLDYDRKYQSDSRVGYIGDVVIYGCASGGGGESVVSDAADAATPKGTGTPTGTPLCTGPSCILVACLLNPSLCAPPPPDKVCAQTTVALKCGVDGSYVANVTYGGAPANLGQIKLTDPSGQISSLPQVQPTSAQFSVPLTGLAPGQVGQINLCSFDANAAAKGARHDCCNTTVSFKIPSNACQPEVQE